MKPSSELNPSARVTWLAAPAASPGQCGMCGKPSHEQGFADPRLDYEFYGSLIFCRDCTGDLASVFGYLAPDAYKEMAIQMERQNHELLTLRKAILGLESAVDSLTSYRDLRNESVSDTGVSFEPVADEVIAPEPDPTEQDVSESDGVPVELTDTGATEDVVVDEPVDEQGRDDVRSITSADVNALLDL